MIVTRATITLYNDKQEPLGSLPCRFHPETGRINLTQLQLPKDGNYYTLSYTEKLLQHHKTLIFDDKYTVKVQGYNCLNSINKGQ
jgi:hypothetical protein